METKNSEDGYTSDDDTLQRIGCGVLDERFSEGKMVRLEEKEDVNKEEKVFTSKTEGSLVLFFFK